METDIRVPIDLDEDGLEIQTRALDLIEKGAVCFMYMKRNGSWRKAIGTRLDELIQRSSPDGKGKIDKSEETMASDKKNGYLRYYDMEMKGVRTCYISSIVACDYENADLDYYREFIDENLL